MKNSYIKNLSVNRKNIFLILIALQIYCSGYSQLSRDNKKHRLALSVLYGKTISHNLEKYYLAYNPGNFDYKFHYFSLFNVELSYYRNKKINFPSSLELNNYCTQVDNFVYSQCFGASGGCYDYLYNKRQFYLFLNIKQGVQFNIQFNKCGVISLYFDVSYPFFYYLKEDGIETTIPSLNYASEYRGIGFFSPRFGTNEVIKYRFRNFTQSKSNFGLKVIFSKYYYPDNKLLSNASIQFGAEYEF